MAIGVGAGAGTALGLGFGLGLGLGASTRGTDGATERTGEGELEGVELGCGETEGEGPAEGAPEGPEEGPEEGSMDGSFAARRRSTCPRWCRLRLGLATTRTKTPITSIEPIRIQRPVRP